MCSALRVVGLACALGHAHAACIGHPFLHEGYCIHEEHAHLPGWNTLAIGGTPKETHCATRHWAHGKLLCQREINNPTVKWHGRNRTGNPYLEGHPIYGHDTLLHCECPALEPNTEPSLSPTPNPTVPAVGAPTSCAQPGDQTGVPSRDPALQPDDLSDVLCSEFTFHKGYAAGTDYIMSDPDLGTAERWGTFDVTVNQCKEACELRADCLGFDYYGPEIGPGYHLKQCAMFTNEPALGGGGTAYWRTYTKNELTPETMPEPTLYPTSALTLTPTASPTPGTTAYPTPAPSLGPTPQPTLGPTAFPTPMPTPYPTREPTHGPTSQPTPNPSLYPTPELSTFPTPIPTLNPTPAPIPSPTREPTVYPTPGPTTPIPTASPTSPAEVTRWTQAGSKYSISDDGFTVTKTGSTGWNGLVTGGDQMASGIHYAEMVVNEGGSGDWMFGMARPGLDHEHRYADTSDVYYMYAYSGSRFGGPRVVTEADPQGSRANQLVNGDNIGVLVNLDAGWLKFFKNGAQFGPGFTSGVTGPLVWAAEIRHEGNKFTLLPHATVPATLEPTPEPTTNP